MKPCSGLLACAWLFSLVSTPFAAVAECNFNETLETDSSILLTQAPLAEMYDPYKAFQESYAEVESFKLNDMIKSITVTIASLIPEVGPIVSLILNIFWPSGPGPEKYLLDAMQDWTKKYVEAKLANLLTELIKRDVNQTQHQLTSYKWKVQQANNALDAGNIKEANAYLSVAFVYLHQAYVSAGSAVLQSSEVKVEGVLQGQQIPYYLMSGSLLLSVQREFYEMILVYRKHNGQKDPPWGTL